MMDITMLVLTGIGALAAVVSAIFAVKANNAANNVLANMCNTRVKNAGKNSGVVNGINTGEIKNENTRD